jgi:hypothetical protein
LNAFLHRRIVVAAAVFSLVLPTLQAQGFVHNDATENQFSISLPLFATLAAINAAGYDAGMDSALNDRFQLRTQIRAELAKKDIKCLADLREFYKAHKKPSDSADLGQYISFALTAGDAPNFTLPSEVPPDVEPLKGFSELLARFYQQADIQSL